MTRRTGHYLLTFVTLIVTNQVLLASDSLNSNGFQPGAIKFRFVNDYLIVAPVTVNGHGPYDMVIDTGSSLSFVDTQTAVEAELKEVDHVDLYALFGVDRLKWSFASFTFEGREFERTVVAIQNLAALQRIDPRIRGILGWNVLGKFNFLIDYARHCLEIRDMPEAFKISGKRVPYARKSGLVLVEAVIPDLLNRQLQLILDSGAQNVHVYSRFAPIRLDLNRYEIRHSTVSSARVYPVLAPAMKVGTHRVSAVPVELLIGPQDRQGHVEDGVLPLRLFRTVYFDNTEGCIVLDARSQKESE